MSRRTYTSSSGYTSAGQAECPTCRSLSEEKERLHEKIGQYKEIIKVKEAEWRRHSEELEDEQNVMTKKLQKTITQLHQELRAREDEYQSNLHHSGEMEKIRMLELEISGLQRDNTQLHQELHARKDEYQSNLHRSGEMKKIKRLELEISGLQRDNTQLHQELRAREDEYQSNLHRSGEMKKKIKRLEQEFSGLQADLFESEKKLVNETVIQEEKDTKHKQKTCKLKHEITKLKEDIQQLREMVSKAFRRCHLSIRMIQAVVIEDIEIDHVNAWFDFLNPLELSLEDIDRNNISLVDARWNVSCVMSKWLSGCGSSPKTWGTLLDAMHGGSKFLCQLATRTEFKLLEGLACLDFQLCPSCRKKFANKEQEMTFTEEKPRLSFPVEDTSPRTLPGINSSDYEPVINVHHPPPP